MNKNVLFIPIAKVDQARREVWGWAAEEAPDKAGEIMDYDSSKPLFLEWSAAIQKASDGKSLGNVRAMHANIAAGRLVHFEPHDDEKKFYVGAHIVDDAEWAKVEAGVYTGFSVGGSYAKRWTDPADRSRKRYTAAPAEISLVDNPCMYGATFEMVKGEGLAPDLVEFVGQGAGDDSDAGALVQTASTLAMLADMHQDDLAKAAADPDLAKAGARHSAADTAAIQSIHDSACKLGAGCDGAGGVEKLFKRDGEAWYEAFRAGNAVHDVASALVMLSSLATSLLETAPDAAQVITSAASVVSSVMEDLTGKLAAATAAQAQAQAQKDLIDEAAEAVALAMFAKFDAADSPLAKVLNANGAAQDAALTKLLTPITSQLDDVAAQLGALQTAAAGMEKRLASSGPIVRDVGVQTQQQDPGQSELGILQKMIASETDPAARQALQMRASRLQISLVHAGGGVRIG